MKAGRPQGGPKGQTEQDNALAVFLRNLTKGLTVRELADRYKSAGSKTLWGEYRSGTKTIPLHVLERLVHDSARDERSRTQLLATARDLHAQAVAAQQTAASAEPEAVGRSVTPEETLDQATTTLQDAERLIHILLGVIAGLQMQLALPTAPAAASTPQGAGDSTQAANDVREAESRLLQVRLVHTALTRVRNEAAASLPRPDTDAAQGLAHSEGSGGDEPALPVRDPAASRGAAAILLVSRATLTEQHTAVRHLIARVSGTPTTTYSTSTLPALPRSGAPTDPAAEQVRDRPTRWRTAKVTVTAVALTAVVTGAVVVTTLGLRNHEPSRAAAQAQDKATATTDAVPSSSPSPSPRPSPSASREPSATPPARSPASSPSSLKGRSISSVPDNYVGAWEGEFTEPGEQAPSLRRIVLREGPVGTEIADILTQSRTSLCQAEGTLRSTGTLVVIAPRTTTATPTHLCTPAGDITLRTHGDAGLTWKSDGITVTLHRTSSPDRAVPAAYVGTWRAQDGNDPTSSVRMTIRQGALGKARATFTWDGDAHHCEGYSVLASGSDTLVFGPETVTASEPEGFCTQTPSRAMTRPQDDTMHVQWADSPDGTQLRAFTFSRVN
ncbi:MULTISPECIES: hypothetical protein [unclassified Streptomyces]|uniref:hypothetical protein n=1 Tax=unclassified Streptomyces TaxID=2593676 RepID=UPI0038251AE7